MSEACGHGEEAVTDWADLAVEKLEANILDRRGWKHEWGGFCEAEPEIAQEVRETFARLIREAREEAYALGLP